MLRRILLAVLPALALTGEAVGPTSIAPALTAAINAKDTYAILALLDQDALGARIDALDLKAGIVTGQEFMLRRQIRLGCEAYLHALAKEQDWSSGLAVASVVPAEGQGAALVTVKARIGSGWSRDQRLVLRVVRASDGAYRIDDVMDPYLGLWKTRELALQGLADWDGTTQPWLTQAAGLPGLIELANSKPDAVRTALAEMDVAAMPPPIRQVALLTETLAAWHAGDPAWTERSLAALRGLDPGNPLIPWIAAQGAKRRGDAATAISEGLACLAACGPDQAMLDVLAWAYARNGGMTEFEALCRRILAQDPGEIAAFRHVLPQATPEEIERLFHAAPDPAPFFRLLDDGRKAGRRELCARLATAWLTKDAAATEPRIWLAERLAEQDRVDDAIDLLLAKPAAAPTEEDAGEDPAQAALELALEHHALGAFAKRFADPARCAGMLAASWRLGREHGAELRGLLPALREGGADAAVVGLLAALIDRFNGADADAATGFLAAWPKLGEDLRGQHLERMLDSAVLAGQIEQARQAITPEQLPELLHCVGKGGDADRILALTATIDPEAEDPALLWAWRGAAFLAKGERDQALAMALRAIRSPDDEDAGFVDAASPPGTLLQILAYTAPDLARFGTACRVDETLATIIGPAAEHREQWKTLTGWCRSRKPPDTGNLELLRLRARAAEGLGNFGIADTQLAWLCRQPLEDWELSQARRWRTALWDRAGRSGELFGQDPPTAADVQHAIYLRREAADEAGVGALLAKHAALLPPAQLAIEEALHAHRLGDLAKARTLLSALVAGQPESNGWALHTALVDTLIRLNSPEAVYDLAGKDFISLEELLAGRDPAAQEALVARHAQARPDDGQAELWRIRQLYKAGKYDEARKRIASQPDRRDWRLRILEQWCRLRQGEALDHAGWNLLEQADEPGNADADARDAAVLAALKPANDDDRRRLERIRLRGALRRGDVAAARLAKDSLDALTWSEAALEPDERLALLLLLDDRAGARRLAIFNSLAGGEGCCEDEGGGLDSLSFARLAAVEGDVQTLGGWLARMRSEGHPIESLWSDRWIGAALRGPCKELAARWPEPAKK